jgi:hypothetical protein
MSRTRRLGRHPAADAAGYSRLISAHKGGILERLRALCSELFDPKIAERRDGECRAAAMRKPV